MSRILDLTEDKSESWYNSLGQPIYDCDLRKARKEQLFPRVTSILGVWPKPELNAWKGEQLVLSALSLPRQDQEPLDAFAKRVVEDSKAQVSKAAQWGTDFHKLTELAMAGQAPVVPEDYYPHYSHWHKWYNETVQEVIGAEVVLVNNTLGYGGRMDNFLKIDGSRVLADLKSRSVKNGKPAWYDEQVMQLAAYGACLPVQDLPAPQKFLSIVINRDKPEPPYLHWWTDEEVNQGWERFRACFNLWKLYKKYNPAG